MNTEILKRGKRTIKLLNFIYPFLRFIFQIRLIDEEKIPEEPTVFVANHNIGAVVEILALIYAWEERFHFTYTHPIYGLGHRFGFRIPLFRTLIQKLGMVPANHESAAIVLKAGYSLMIFPGGNREACRPHSQRNEVDFGGHHGWIKIAKQANRKIMPIAISGSHSVNPVLLRSRLLAQVLLLTPILRLKWFPITAGQLILATLFFFTVLGHLPTWGLVLATWSVFAVTPLIPIWPAKITIRFLDPIESTGTEDAIYTQTQTLIENALHEMQRNKS